MCRFQWYIKTNLSLFSNLAMNNTKPDGCITYLSYDLESWCEKSTGRDNN